MFERTANLVNNQIINYRCDPTEKWLVLIGIAPGSPEVFGPLGECYSFLYSKEFIFYTCLCMEYSSSLNCRATISLDEILS